MQTKLTLSVEEGLADQLREVLKQHPLRPSLSKWFEAKAREEIEAIREKLAREEKVEK